MHSAVRQTSNWKGRNRRRGSAMVESAFAFIVFCCLLLGAFDFGQILFVHQALTERVRWAVRWGIAQDTVNTANIKNMILYRSTSEGTSAYYDLTSAQVSVTTAGSGTQNYRVIAQISGHQYTTFSPFFAGIKSSPTITVVEPLGLFN